MGQIRHFNNGKWTIYTSGEGLSAYTGNSNTYYIGADLDNDGHYSKANPDGTLVDMEGAGISSLIDITYNELYSKVVNGELIPSQWYRLTDYRSVNFLNGWDIANNNPSSGTNFNPREIYTGETEVLVIQAVSENEISPIGYSETYPNDIVQYEPYTNKIGVDWYFSNGGPLPDSTTLTGFDLQWDGTNVYFNMPTGYPALFGHYFYLYCEFDSANYFQEGTYEPLTPEISVCQYPYTSDDPDYQYPKAMSRIRVENNGQKIVLIDLDYTDYSNYDIGTLEVNTIYEIGNAYGWITKRQDVFRNITAPIDFRGRKYRRFECELFGAIKSIGYSPSGSYNDGLYTITSYSTTSVDGINAEFIINIVDSTITGIFIKNPGKLYKNGDTITIPGTSLGGLSSPNLTISINDIYTLIDYVGIGNNFNGSLSTSYKDFKCFGNDGYDCYNIEWNDNGGPDMFYYRGTNDNLVFMEDFSVVKIGTYSFNNTFVSYCYNCEFSYNFFRNTVNYWINNKSLEGFYNNKINAYCYNNVFKEFYSNEIYNTMYSNDIKSDFGVNKIQTFNVNNINGFGFNNNVINSFDSSVVNRSFYNNVVIGEGSYATNNSFKEATNNIILGNLVNNSFNGLMANNTINGDTFSFNFNGNIFNNNVQNTIFKKNFRFNSINYDLNNVNFSAATHVYGEYNCNIYRRPDGQLRLSYYDNLDSLVITGITA